MDDMSNFCLRWNDFETNIRQSFRELRQENDYFDVTLATDDHHQIQAHKIILSAGSEFFSEIFRKTKHPAPFIFLKGINRVDLENIIDFMYNGEANIAQEELSKFLATAQELQVKGIQSKDNENGVNERLKKETEDEEEQQQFSESETIYIPEDPIHQESLLVPSEEIAVNFDTSDVAAPVDMEQDSLVMNTNNELDLQIEQMIEKNEGVWYCKVCSKTAKQKGDIRKHTETHIEGFSHECHLCNKIFSTRNSLQNHINASHSLLSFTCPLCAKSGMNKIAFKNHKRKCNKTI
eukprot:GFUD01069113.1.p1 GENE.GFUD01069113.1~~GFUD01069113.1.p1  ORF type:complete len:293 (+),score=58.11 GFUD01069113.1:110-988(+)